MHIEVSLARPPLSIYLQISTYILLNASKNDSENEYRKIIQNTGESLSEALIFASIKDDRWNYDMFLVLVLAFTTIYVHNMF